MSASCMLVITKHKSQPACGRVTSEAAGKPPPPPAARHVEGLSDKILQTNLAQEIKETRFCTQL